MCILCMCGCGGPRAGESYHGMDVSLTAKLQGSLDPEVWRTVTHTEFLGINLKAVATPLGSSGDQRWRTEPGRGWHTKASWIITHKPKRCKTGRFLNIRCIFAVFHK